MIKSILHPGNGIDFAKKGDYVKFYLLIFDNNKNVLFNSLLEIRSECLECNLINALEELITEMSLFEKCQLEIENNKETIENNYYQSEIIKEIFTNNLGCNKITFEVEILNIN